MKVLIVDDNQRVRQLLQDYLPANVEMVYECVDGIDALESYARYKPDWVLMDWQMPEMDGITATEQIIERFPDAQICLVTSFDDEDIREGAHNAGARDFVLKDNLADLKRVLAN